MCWLRTVESVQSVLKTCYKEKPSLDWPACVSTIRVALTHGAKWSRAALSILLIDSCDCVQWHWLRRQYPLAGGFIFWREDCEKDTKEHKLKTSINTCGLTNRSGVSLALAIWRDSWDLAFLCSPHLRERRVCSACLSSLLQTSEWNWI